MGYFGEEGSFSHLVARKRFPRVALQPCLDSRTAFQKLQAGEFRHIVVPIENASSGMILPTLDQCVTLSQSGGGDKWAVRECIAMGIRLVLLARSARDSVERIYSHQAPLTHARAWLEANYPQAELIELGSTSQAAQKAAREPHSAALAGRQVAELYDLQIVREDVQQDIANRTKFYLVGAPLTASKPATHTALVFELPHRAGSLEAALHVLSEKKLNLTQIISRPIPGRFNEYRFMIEFEGGLHEKRPREAWQRLGEVTRTLHLLGSYAIRELKAS